MCAYVLNERSAGSRPETACVSSQLELVESRLLTAVESDVHTASDIAVHLLEAGGKRIRPALVLISAGACGGDVNEPRVIEVATAAELVHMASLVHDDVVDETSERRGVATANGEWGNKISVLSGDFMLAKAFLLLAGLDESRITEVVSSTAVVMTESEILQAECEGSVSGWQASYWKVIRGKTAAFTAACCVCGATLAKACPESCRMMEEFGANFGLAFQITDDLLDIVGDPNETGKDIGTDLMHGKFTLPTLLALKSCSEDDGRRLARLVEKGFLSREEAHEAASIVIACGAARQARETAMDCGRRAQACVEPLPESAYKSALQSLALAIAGRDS